MQRIKTKIGEMLTPANMAPWPKVRERLNRLLLGWSAYFGYGSLAKAYRDVDHYVVDHVRDFLARRHKMQNRGTRRFSATGIYGELGVVSLWKHHPNARAESLAMKSVGKPDAGNPHVRFDERGGETGRCRMAQATAPFLELYLGGLLAGIASSASRT